MFAKPAQPTGNLFGTVSAAPTSSTGFSFGTPAVTAGTPAGFSFGGNNANPASGFSLGSAGTLFTSTNPVASSTALGGSSTFGGFGVSTPASSVVRPTFAMPQTAQPSAVAGTTPGFFGGLGASTATASNAGAPTGGFAFGAPTLSTTGTTTFGQGLSGFGTSAMPSLGLGASSLTTPATTSLGSFGTVGGGVSAFGTSATPSMGFLGSSITCMPSSTFGGTSAAVGSQFVGLGGVGISRTTAGGAKSDSKTLKEYPVAPEMTALAENFKKYIKDQKNIREEISRYSSKPIAKVQEEAASLRQAVSFITNSIQRNATAIRKLKRETAEESRNVEVMQRTKDMPLSLQYENTAPVEYFQKLVATFEVNMNTFRQQIEMLERHLAAASRGQHSAAFTPQQLLATIRRLYETFVYLASELQTVHETLENYKERYIAHRRAALGDGTNVFESRGATAAAATTSIRSSLAMIPVTTVGPSPFSNTHGSAIFASAMERAQQFTGAGQPPPTVGLGGTSTGSLYSSFNLGSLGLGGSSLGGIGAGTTPGLMSGSFLSSSNVVPVKPLGGGILSAPVGGYASGGGLGGSSFGVANAADFQLQRPPIGNKRGKR